MRIAFIFAPFLPTPFRRSDHNRSGAIKYVRWHISIACPRVDSAFASVMGFRARSCSEELFTCETESVLLLLYLARFSWLWSVAPLRKVLPIDLPATLL